MSEPQNSKRKSGVSNRTPEEESRRRYRRGRIYLRLGQSLMAVGALVVVQHWLTHIEAFGPDQPPLWLDMAAGYPMGTVLLVVGAIRAGTKPS